MKYCDTAQFITSVCIIAVMLAACGTLGCCLSNLFLDYFFFLSYLRVLKSAWRDMFSSGAFTAELMARLKKTTKNSQIHDYFIQRQVLCSRVWSQCRSSIFSTRTRRCSSWKWCWISMEFLCRSQSSYCMQTLCWSCTVLQQSMVASQRAGSTDSPHL